MDYESEIDLRDGLNDEDAKLWSTWSDVPIGDRNAYKGQYFRMLADGGIMNPMVKNRVQSPGKLFAAQDDEGIPMTQRPEFVEMCGYRFYWVTPENAESLNASIADGHVKALYIVSEKGMDDGVVRRVLASPAKPLALAFVLGALPSDQFDLSILLEHTQLEYVSWDQPPVWAVPLGHLTNLTQCAIDWSHHVSGLEALRRLRWLRLDKYKPTSGGLEQLTSSANTLQRLEFVHGNFRDLAAIATLAKLEHLSISYVRSKVDLSTLSSESLRQLELDRCPNLLGRLNAATLPNLVRVWGSSAPA